MGSAGSVRTIPMSCSASDGWQRNGASSVLVLHLRILIVYSQTISCTSATFADEIFQQLGVSGGFNLTTAANISTIAFPVLPSTNTTDVSNSTTTSGDDSEDGEDDDCDGEDDTSSAPAVVTQTVVVTVTATPSSLPTTTASEEPATTVVISQASASAIIASIEANGGTVVTSVVSKTKPTSTAMPTSTASTSSEAADSVVTASATSTKPLLILNPATATSSA